VPAAGYFPVVVSYLLLLKGYLRIKKYPFIPPIGTKGFSFRGTTRNSPYGALSGASTPKTVNAVTRQILLEISDRSSWGKARYCTQAAPTIPHSLKLCLSVQGDPIIAFLYQQDINITIQKMQALFMKTMEIPNLTALSSPCYHKNTEKIHKIQVIL
jgi:hypothetical protein